MVHPTVTRSESTIHNPEDPRHHMRVRQSSARIVIARGNVTLAESLSALKVTEAGHDLYDTVVYIPRADVAADLVPVEGKSTHCPLKGDASYYADASGEVIAWSYEKPLSFASELKGYVAFYPQFVSITEFGASA